MSTVYTQRFDGEWVDVSEDKLFACCDCGLVHRQEFLIVGESVLRRVFRDRRATADRRRCTQVKANIKALRNKR